MPSIYSWNISGIFSEYVLNENIQIFNVYAWYIFGYPRDILIISAV